MLTVGSIQHDFEENKKLLARKILTDFNNAFQSVIEDYTHTLPSPNESKDNDKDKFKQRFLIVANEINLACNQMHGENKDVNPHNSIIKVQKLIGFFANYPARNNNITHRLFSCLHRNNNSFGELFYHRIEKYYDYLLKMIEYTCSSHKENELSQHEIRGVFNFITNNRISQYRKHAMQDPLLKSNFQTRESLMMQNDTVGALNQIQPEIPKLDNRVGYQTLK